MVMRLGRLRQFAVAVPLAAILLAPVALAAEELTIVSWGGSYGESQRHAFFEPFSKETGITVLEDEWQGDMAKIRAMVETHTYQGAVFDAESAHLVSGCDEGL